jgi:hypothetical protein
VPGPGFYSRQASIGRVGRRPELVVSDPVAVVSDADAEATTVMSGVVVLQITCCTRLGVAQNARPFMRIKGKRQACTVFEPSQQVIETLGFVTVRLVVNAIASSKSSGVFFADSN